MRSTSFFLIACAVAVTTACETRFDVPEGDDNARAPLPSDAVATRDLGAAIVVSDHDEGSTRAYVFLRGAERNIELVPPDALRASTGETTIALEPRVFESAERTVSYLGRLDGARGRGPVTVTLLRGPETLESTVVLPDPFDLRAESTGAFSRRTEDVVLRWAPSGLADRVEWFARGDCIGLRSETEVPDTGSLLIPRSSWISRGESCDVTITVMRSRRGMLSRAFGGGGQVLGQQVRTVTLPSRP